MATLDEAWRKTNGRIQGVVEAGQEGVLAMVAATTAGTDVPGPDLTARIGLYSDSIVIAARELWEQEIGGPESTEAEWEAFRDFVYRHNNGTALSWFWAGYELRRLEES